MTSSIGPRSIHSGTTRNLWLRALYENGLVRADREVQKLTDKLHFYRQLKNHLGEECDLFHPKTLGWREATLDLDPDNPEFLEQTRVRLQKQFPSGFIVKPTTVINTGGDGDGYWFEPDRFWSDLQDRHPVLVNALKRSESFVAPLVGECISNEELCLQASVAGLAGQRSLAAKNYDEIRIHTYEGDILPFITYSRWKVRPVKGLEKFRQCNEFVKKFLGKLPVEFLAGQAWGLDVMIVDGVLRVIDINTNRGQPGQWSGFLTRPWVIGAYTRHIETKKAVRFSGVEGWLLRAGLGNSIKYLKKIHVEGIR